jgi:pyruvate,water dikinase
MSQLVVPLDSAQATDASRFGPKAANLAALGQAGLPVPGGYCLDAQAYRQQLAALDLQDAARGVFGDEGMAARRHALKMKLALMDEAIEPATQTALTNAWETLQVNCDGPIAVRSSALVEDCDGSNFAGQFESFLGLERDTDYLTAVRSCWSALWSTRALRYMATHELDPADTAMALIIQPVVKAIASGGGLSQTPEGGMLLSATWGLGSAIAQGEVVPDRYALNRDGTFIEARSGRKSHSVDCVHGAQSVAPERSQALCLTEQQAVELGALLLRAEAVIGGPTEIEWALDEVGFKLLQARPLSVATANVPDEIWVRRPRLNGQPAGIGWGTGRACVVNCECELSRVAPGDILVTKVAGPALSHILPSVAGVVAELGGSTSHFASLARERGIPMVLGVLDATQTIPDGSTVAVDGVAGIVRWIH